MLLGSENKPDKRRYSEEFDHSYREDILFAAQLIERQQYEEAWIRMDTLERESIPLLYNKALCLRDVYHYEATITLLDRASALLIPYERTPIPVETQVLKAIREKQKNRETYLHPITFRYVDLFPHQLRDSILRFMTDTYLALGNTAKILEIATPLQSKGYRNIIEALKTIK